MESRTEMATLAGGCFWCLEAVYELLSGVESVKSGYMGGHVDGPTYEQVCTGGTGHAEVLQVAYDPAIISFPDILDVFFTIHDPTTKNRQGADVGSQYRSAIFYHDEQQRMDAYTKIAEVGREGIWNDPIVTELAPLGEFYPAETVHDEYFRNNPNQPYCQAVVAPKVAKFRKQHLDRLRAPAG
ncbi:MAG: peptide-methionine (S)-S-oxide reductase MsrA [Gemmatimonadota bacterium]|nr:peptide-methionine (S)-S-oxide reductase MsrA [Gemmatimonadota bacterium]